MMTRWQEEGLIARIREIRAKTATEAASQATVLTTVRLEGEREGTGAPLAGADRSACHENRTTPHLP